jgi:hypothetical protein
MQTTPRIVSADRLDGGIIVTFADDRCALYSAALLSEIFARARDLTDEPENLF